MYFGPPPPKKDEPRPTPARETPDAPQRTADAPADAPAERPPTREERAARRAEAAERESVGIGRAIFCLVFLVWAVSSGAAGYGRVVAGEKTTGSGTACAVIALGGLGLFVGGKSLLRLVLNVFDNEPPPPRRRRRPGARPDSPPDASPPVSDATHGEPNGELPARPSDAN